MFRRRLARAALVLLTLVGLLAVVIRVRHGGGSYFPNRSGAPLLSGAALETVAELPLPPGNVAVATDGRVFLTFHPEGHPDLKVAELVGGKAVPYPNAAFQRSHFQTVLSLRIDRQNRLWTLDFGDHGTGRPRLLAFDLARNDLVHEFDFSRELAGLGSMLNDFQVSPEGDRIYIADASIFRKRPALVVYEVAGRKARRLLEGHPSVEAQPYITRIDGRDIVVLGLFAIRPGVDSIALDKRGEWLYYAAVTAERMYRVRTADLNDMALTAEQLAARVEDFAEKTMSDGLSMDLDDNIYITDMEHSAILSLGKDRRLRTLLVDARLRWPDGLSFGPDGWLYVTCSSLQHVILKSRGHVRAHAPYHILRFRPGPAGVPGQ
jgi:sugar lactone lactonase YvrE